jgi:ATP-dependent HslUV protease ATP-binding subunit HslU
MPDETPRHIPSPFTPREIVSELDRYIIGQHDAKRAVAIALRNRWRRQQVDSDLRDEIAPKNIIMIGTTGVGKTEIARRLARLAQAPFVKVEASKFTEVGYVGRDVDSIVRDLVEIAVTQVKGEEKAKVEARASKLAEDRLVELLVRKRRGARAPEVATTSDEVLAREDLRKKLRVGELEREDIELEMEDRQGPMIEVFSASGMEDMDIRLQNMFQNLPGFHGKRKVRKLSVAEARKLLSDEESGKLVDMDKVVAEARVRTEQSGIVFLDEIDKISGRERSTHGPDVSREGVQRDLLPIIEGSTVNTKYGPVRTDHVLFIAAGAFHVSKPSDLIPELQGRFPIRVELTSLGREDFVRILTEPRNALIKQYRALLATEGIRLEFTDEAVREIAALAFQVNDRTQDIGARRLHTVLEALIEDISFRAPELDERDVVIEAEYVRERLSKVIADQDLSRYIL